MADENSWLAAQQIFGELEAKCQKQFKVKRHDVQQIANKLQPVIKKLRVRYKFIFLFEWYLTVSVIGQAFVLVNTI